MPSPFLTAALAAIERGHTVFPIRDKQPLTKFVNGDPLHSLAATEGDARRMDKRFPGATGAGIKLPPTVGVFDCDTREAAAWCKRNLPETYVVRTGRSTGGAHFYVSVPTRLRHNPRMPVPGLEWKTLGGYVVAPGSVHHSGSTYEVEHDRPVAQIPRALALKIGPPRPSQDQDATADELAAWASTAHDVNDPLYTLAVGMAQDEIENVDRFLRTQLPEGAEWGNKFFGQGVHLGRWVGQGILDYDEAKRFLYGIFDGLDNGEGGVKGEAHVKRSIRRGLAAGARKSQ